MRCNGSISSWVAVVWQLSRAGTAVLKSSSEKQKTEGETVLDTAEKLIDKSLQIG